MRVAFHLFLLSSFLLTVGCATIPGPGRTGGAGDAPDRIAELNAALEREKDEGRVAALLFERGHMRLALAESVREGGRAVESEQVRLEFSTHILYALQDFEAIIAEYPASPEAPEALYHLGIAYDYPNISSFGLAVRYYKRTIDEYPGSEAARSAEQAIRKMEGYMQNYRQGEHGDGT